MKKILLPTIFLALASVAFAGSNCCEKGGEKTDKDKSASKHVESSVIVAGTGDCGDKCDEKKDKSSAFDSSAQLAGGGCGDKSCGDKSDKSEKSGMSTTSYEVAGSGCSGDKEGKKCGGEKHQLTAAIFA